MGIRVWGLTGGRKGDDAQVLALAQAVGEATFKPLAFGVAYRLPNLALGATLATLSSESRAVIRPPWPDVVIGVGRRSVPVARWIKERSGGRTKLVRIGRPRAPLAWFDLVITTPQYDLPDAPNVLKLLLPAVRNEPPPADEVERLRRAISGRPRPWIGLLVGGSRLPYRLDAGAAARLASAAGAVAGRQGGSLLLSTSPRTGRAAAAALARGLEQPVETALSAGPSRHRAVLALADRFIVTGESASMLAEACLTLKPVEIFTLPRLPLPAWSARSGIGRWLAGSGVMSPPRDTAKLVRRLIEGGHAHLLGDDNIRTFVPAPDELSRAAAAVRRLVGDR